MTKKIDIDQIVCDFVSKGNAIYSIHTLDRFYVANELLTILKKEQYEAELTPSIPLPDLLDSMDQMVEYGVMTGVIEDSLLERERLEARIMNVITPLPSIINQDFWEAYREAPMRATNDFYELSQRNDYIKTRQIAKNEHFITDSPYGKLDITINLSKPEKSKKDIEEAQKAVGNYPECQLCVENEGYNGREGIAARTNHRIVRIPLQGENWGFQYSPYAYYKEHCIVFTEKHIPMNVTTMTIQNLIELVTVLPHYFMGSNAGLPIVGGSLLGHEHFQGGQHHFPMEDAEVLERWDWKGQESVTAERLYWPISVIRLRSIDSEKIIAAGAELMDEWNGYCNEELNILASTNGERHNAVTLIARRKGEAYELDVVLRNNRTTKEYPDGIFHPHPDVQHIKKENIGLIEVLGLAILPPRLKKELKEVEAYLLGEDVQIADYHQEWANQLKDTPHLTDENVTEIVRQGVGKKFQRVMEDAGVFKQNKEGQHAFKQFTEMFQTTQLVEK
ncbi:UDP-glucose--hexose-1-phosphate uridylyltransferase [Jeotgalibaca sp. MA1X17-3]|uniref:UDP-glucose--hexose-1-phosphate uridylyltransferase n=1 Tax=Jeotgalibaca sp. MA1X17-3 TaxID=2908211 RepID=UPI001F364B15|nr:UDP-glucose--hexose-1-phosphate uridylyltransferase [Jeotgalibaca sp. MA1X17-3]UJF15532.1 UDP-glucose--hexose-1-phosphate uridylyltransferase [Jeotgalibaca sp. MA1X17-3]